MACIDNVISRGSDFFLEVTFCDENGVEIGVPEYDFVLEYYVYSDKKFEASQRGRVLTNCSIEGKKLIVAIDKPSLDSGKLHRRAVYHIPDSRFEDGYRTLVEESIIGTVK